MSKDSVNKSLFLELKQLKNIQTTFQREAVFYLNTKKLYVYERVRYGRLNKNLAPETSNIVKIMVKCGF